MADITPIRTPAETGLARLFETLSGSLLGEASPRAEAFRGFAERGLPHRRVEEFKYTDLRAAMREAAPFAPAPSPEAAGRALAAARAFAGVDAARLAFVDGHLLVEASDLAAMPAGVEVVPLRDALAAGHPLLAHLHPVKQTRNNPLYQLNSAFMADGAVIRVAAGTVVERPLHLRFVAARSEPFATATRVLVVLEEGASLTLLESHEGSTASQPNDVLDATIADGATLRHVRINAEGRDTLALSSLAVRLGRKSALETANVVTGAVLSRHQVYMTFAGEDGRAQVNGATMLNGRQHADTTLLADHAAPGGISRELFKTVIDDAAVGVFQGKIIVQPVAQKTDGRMMSRCLLLSDEGQMMNKPELEIFADDVQCGHGATCGALDDELLFYLMARGLSKRDAERLLVQAFLGEAVEAVSHEGAREAVVEMIEAWLAARG